MRFLSSAPLTLFLVVALLFLLFFAAVFFAGPSRPRGPPPTHSQAALLHSAFFLRKASHSAFFALLFISFSHSQPNSGTLPRKTSHISPTLRGHRKCPSGTATLDADAPPPPFTCATNSLVPPAAPPRPINIKSNNPNSCCTLLMSAIANVLLVDEKYSTLLPGHNVGGINLHGLNGEDH